MPRFKGLVLLNAREFCRERFGDVGWRRVVASMAQSDRTTIEEVVHVGWYDIGLYDRVHENIDRELGDGDRKLMAALGHFCAERDLTTVHRVFLRMASPAFLFSKYGDYWRRYQDSGEWHVERETERRVRGTLSEWGSTSDATCVRLAAYIEKFLELCGVPNTRVTRPKCRSRGDRACEYLVEWQKR